MAIGQSFTSNPAEKNTPFWVTKPSHEKRRRRRRRTRRRTRTKKNESESENENENEKNDKTTKRQNGKTPPFFFARTDKGEDPVPEDLDCGDARARDQHIAKRPLCVPPQENGPFRSVSPSLLE